MSERCLGLFWGLSARSMTICPGVVRIPYRAIKINKLTHSTFSFKPNADPATDLLGGQQNASESDASR
jgi:hypothetical protein